ncbi:MAG: hypothetical protein P8X74_18345 [Reinekea sp.]
MFFKIAGTPLFLGSKQESMACALRRYSVTDSGVIECSGSCQDLATSKCERIFLAWKSILKVNFRGYEATRIKTPL